MLSDVGKIHIIQQTDYGAYMEVLMREIIERLRKIEQSNDMILSEISKKPYLEDIEHSLKGRFLQEEQYRENKRLISNIDFYVHKMRERLDGKYD